jgi:hypothetical protein
MPKPAERLSLKALTPYVSLSVFRLEGTKKGIAECLTELEAQIFADLDSVLGIEKSQTAARYRLASHPQPPAAKDSVWVTSYTERRCPSWLAGARGSRAPDSNDLLADEINQLVIIMAAGAYITILATEDGARDLIERALVTFSGTAGPRPHRVPSELLHKAFGRGDAKTLWLRGVHRPTSRRASGKMLIGTRLQDALNPIEDQTFTYSAARCGNDPKKIVGYSPARGRLWMRSTESWDDYTGLIRWIAAELKSAESSGAIADDFADRLALPLGAMQALADPSGLSLVPPDLLNPDPASDGDFTNDVARRWFDQGTFSVSAVPPVQQRQSTTGWLADFDLTASLDGAEVATFRVELDPATTPGNARRRVRRTRIVGSADEAEEIQKLLGRRDGITVWFDSGHTLQGNQVFATRHRDMRFRGWKWKSFGAYPVTSEKPTKDGKPDRNGKRQRVFDPPAVGRQAQSLFCWTIREDCGDELSCTKGWLACDDGSMEVSDFVHYDEHERRLALVHAKGSTSDKTNREVAVTDYEVVASQAMKNLHWLDPSRLFKRMSERNTAALEQLAWRRRNGKWTRGNRTDFLTLLSGITRCEHRRVIVLQPSLRQSLYTKLKKENDSGVASPSANLIRMWQLDLLLLTLEASCHAFGAELVVIGDDS